MEFIRFCVDGVKEIFRGGKLYWSWMGLLTVVALIGASAYLQQFQQGLVVTGMSDQVSWGIYIASFTSLVGIAAAAIMLIIPAYIFHDMDIKEIVIPAEGLAIAACVMSMMFVLIDLGRPDRMWHLLPFIGRFNFPKSMLAWDVLVLNVYLFLTVIISVYLLFSKYKGKEPKFSIYFPLVILSIISALSIHTVTAFLFSSNVARSFWHTGLLAPRFIASAFSAGPAFFLLTVLVMRYTKVFPVKDIAIKRLTMIITIALEINLFLLLAEVFTEFYHQTEHSASAAYLFFGLGGKTALVPWIWSSVFLNISALVIFVLPLKKNTIFLTLACLFLVVGVWIEKGMGLVVPGFIPTPLGEVYEYSPTFIEAQISMGVWAIGLMLYTILAKISIAVNLERIRLD
ncbi:MAG: polysulfide reductase NrfD [Deltaproteobacteria bacterium]|jgi:molybdopterin-containing oxidoreductase family membrane subunit|nr:polysulfide reductase NrfD [Deltaproteobacteria bacterium]MBT4067466.1 polysulfide reductase NrfD [Candidatus Neomarinimicrobiota bacterium]MBT5176836.1 polysulfide reductase NrfD [Candidatus Neomarinimicrobiota bacterium]